ncbi:hypothetical protein SFR_4144 [Streptomyces sp. FR-008]|nr:hypothetical protein SFR_4144 [Streptomyces sp. FR-008]
MGVVALPPGGGDGGLGRLSGLPGGRGAVCPGRAGGVRGAVGPAAHHPDDRRRVRRNLPPPCTLFIRTGEQIPHKGTGDQVSTRRTAYFR